MPEMIRDTLEEERFNALMQAQCTMYMWDTTHLRTCARIHARRVAHFEVFNDGVYAVGCLLENLRFLQYFVDRFRPQLEEADVQTRHRRNALGQRRKVRAV